MQRKILFFAIFLGLLHSMAAKPISVMNAYEPRIIFISLPSPATMDVLNVGSTWIEYGWTPVPGAVSYNLITRDFLTGNILANQTVSAAGVPKATVLNLPVGAYVQSEIRSVDNNGVLSDPPTFAAPIHTIIFELVDSGYSAPSGNSFECTMGTSSSSGCLYTWAQNNFTYFKITNTSNLVSKIFRVDVSDDHITNVWRNSNGGISKFAINLNSAQDRIVITYEGKPVASLISSHATFFPGVLYRDPDLANDMAFTIQKMSVGLKTNDNDTRTIANQEFKADALSAIPNPFSDQLDITLPFSNETQDVNLSLYDLQGRQVLTQSIPGGTQMLKLFTENIAPGLYFLRAQSGDVSEIIRVLKTQ